MKAYEINETYVYEPNLHFFSISTPSIVDSFQGWKLGVHRPLGGSGGMLPREILKISVSKNVFPGF